jgi:hypothetical protein
MDGPVALGQSGALHVFHYVSNGPSHQKRVPGNGVNCFVSDRFKQHRSFDQIENKFQVQRVNTR